MTRQRQLIIAAHRGARDFAELAMADGHAPEDVVRALIAAGWLITAEQFSESEANRLMAAVSAGPVRNTLKTIECAGQA